MQDAIQQNIDAEMNAETAKQDKVDENLIPEAPDAQVLNFSDLRLGGIPECDGQGMGSHAPPH